MRCTSRLVAVPGRDGGLGFRTTWDDVGFRDVSGLSLGAVGLEGLTKLARCPAAAPHLRSRSLISPQSRSLNPSQFSDSPPSRPVRKFVGDKVPPIDPEPLTLNLSPKP